MINRASATAPFHTFDIQSPGGVTLQKLSILNSVSAANFADDQVGLYFGACSRVRPENVREASGDRAHSFSGARKRRLAPCSSGE